MRAKVATLARQASRQRVQFDPGEGYIMQIAGGKFVITGGVSLIGSHITERLLKQGAGEIVLLDNYSLGSPDVVRDLLEEPRVKLVRGDILRVNELYDAFEGANGVFAVAAFLTLPLSINPALGLSVNVQGQVNVFEACRYRGVQKVVFSSSCAVYGEPQSDLAVEADPFTWDGLQPGGGLYGASKVIGENLSRLYHDRYGLKSIALRYSTVYGERQHYRGVNALYIIETYDQILRGERPQIPDDGTEVHDYVHAADVARANVMAMESDVSRESFNVVSGVSTSLNRIVEIVSKITGTSLAPEYKKMQGKVRFTTSSTLHYSREKIEKMLGWKPEVTIEDGIERVIRWREAQDTQRVG
jgi:UDP-glucose 4-epimerase